MSTSALIGMLLICGTVLGGFIYFLSIAIKKEGEKNR
ncbi:MetS family NSS transporter small subunit [Fulvivirgaceae bacterium BMA10]|uniref:MetS family NSS transporter small subunit n=1 Tax=Splendidivirga corallicola TaxID=3051826 RepID=A0ABT8KWN9_9BACT|nr:MetS family NSS transporter small subunit [Fulvivirgaceae bacterium BMA10]